MHWTIHWLATVIPLIGVVYYLWFKTAWFNAMVRQGRQGSRQSIVIFPTIASLLQLEAPVIMPVAKITKVIFTARCILFYAGPCKMAELWLLKGQPEKLQQRIADYCDQAEIVHSPFYPVTALNSQRVIHRYFGLDIASFNGGQYYELVDKPADSPLLSYQEADACGVHIHEPHTKL